MHAFTLLEDTASIRVLQLIVFHYRTLEMNEFNSFLLLREKRDMCPMNGRSRTLILTLGMHKFSRQFTGNFNFPKRC
jgi:hypothetical protein